MNQETKDSQYPENEYRLEREKILSKKNKDSICFLVIVYKLWK